MSYVYVSKIILFLITIFYAIIWVSQEEDIMNVARYIYQSPYSSPVQFGTPDPSVKGEDTAQQKGGNTQSFKLPNESLQNAQNFKTAQTQNVEPTVDTNKLLDVYA